MNYKTNNISRFESSASLVIKVTKMHTYRLTLDVIDGREKILIISKQSFSVNWRQFHHTSSPIFFVYIDNAGTSPLTPGCEVD